MGIFDFFKGNIKPLAPAGNANSSQSLGSDIKFETRLTDRQMNADPAVVHAIAERMIAEDPFVKPFQGRTDADFREGDRRIFEFENVTTMNAAIESDFTLVIEGMALGKIPPAKAEELKPYLATNMATIYAYVIGGCSKQRLNGELVENNSPYGLDIYIQFN